MSIYIGTDKVKSVYVGTDKVKKIYAGTDLVFSASRLPDTFQEVEYIQSTGTQIINTNITPFLKCLAVCDVMFTGGIAYSEFVWGSRSVSFKRYGIIGCNDDKNFSWYMSDQIKAGIPNFRMTSHLNERHTFETYLDYTNGYIKIDGTVLADNLTSATGLSDDPIYLFGFSYPPNIHYSICKCYSVKLFDDGTEIFHGIPCYLKSDPDEAGLFDIITETFYINSGSGIFIKGPDV